MVCFIETQSHANAILTTVPDDAVNNATAQIAITVRGSDWYWTVCAIMIAATFAFVGLATTKPRQQRIFHYITASITMVAAIAYFSMASNLGWTGIAVEFVRSDPKVAGLYREIFYGELQIHASAALPTY
jgi:bacteriorhodopsin